jgi:hypothetical protein
MADMEVEFQKRELLDRVIAATKKELAWTRDGNNFTTEWGDRTLLYTRLRGERPCLYVRERSPKVVGRGSFFSPLVTISARDATYIATQLDELDREIHDWLDPADPTGADRARIDAEEETARERARAAESAELDRLLAV